MNSSSVARFLTFVLVSVSISNPLIAQAADGAKPPSYVICTLNDPPSQPEVEKCVQAIDVQWQGYLMTAENRQRRLITRQNTSEVFQWLAVGGGAAAAGLGVSSNNKSVAVAVGGAALASAVFSILYKGDKTGQRIDACTAIIAAQYQVSSMFGKWIRSSANKEFRTSFKDIVSTEYDNVIVPQLMVCMPKFWVNKA